MVDILQFHKEGVPRGMPPTEVWSLKWTEDDAGSGFNHVITANAADCLIVKKISFLETGFGFTGDLKFQYCDYNAGSGTTGYVFSNANEFWEHVKFDSIAAHDFSNEAWETDEGFPLGSGCTYGELALGTSIIIRGTCSPRTLTIVCPTSLATGSEIRFQVEAWRIKDSDF